jgi:hypothetical protein
MLSLDVQRQINVPIPNGELRQTEPLKYPRDVHTGDAQQDGTLSDAPVEQNIQHKQNDKPTQQGAGQRQSSHGPANLASPPPQGVQLHSQFIQRRHGTPESRCVANHQLATKRHFASVISGM